MTDDEEMRALFIADMRARQPSIETYDEALFYAMQEVATHKGMHKRYFGRIGDGVFYADGKPKNARWYPETTVQEARALLSVELGLDLWEDEQWLDPPSYK